MSFISKHLSRLSKPSTPTEAVSESIYSLPDDKTDESEVASPCVGISVPSEHFNAAVVSNLGKDVFNLSAEEKPKPKPKAFTIADYFASKGIEFAKCDTKEVIAPIESLAFAIAIDYASTKHFVRFLRECIVKKTFEFCFSLTSFSAEEKKLIISLANKLNEYGLVFGCRYVRATNSIKGTISAAPKCINFINGDFLEMYARNVAIGVIKKAAEEHNLDYELLHNIKITRGPVCNELDMIFRIGDKIFWSEIKSGDFDANKYRQIGELINVIPDRLILLAAEKSSDAAACISYFFDCYCANVSTFKASLNDMINKAFQEDNTND